MNILWIYNRPLEPEAGGTERITSLVAKGLSRNGHLCLGMLVFDENSDRMIYNGDEVKDLYSFLKAQKVDVVINQIAYSTWLLDKFLQNGGRKWKSEDGRIISCLHFDPKNPSLLYLLKGNTKKSIIDRINIVKAAVLFKYYERKQQRSEGEIYNHIYDNSDRFVALSETHFPYLHKVMKRSEYDRLFAINNPLTFDDISEPGILAEKQKIVLVCARMSEYHKRISMILKAWKRLQETGTFEDWILILLGDGPDLNGYKEFAKKNNLKNIRFEGQQSPEPFYRKASILLLTSSAEGWGLAITEGLQRAVVPVVMDSCPVFSEIIKSGENGFLTPDVDVSGFSATVMQLMSNPELLRRMQLNSLKSAAEFGLDRTMEKWEKIINK